MTRTVLANTALRRQHGDHDPGDLATPWQGPDPLVVSPSPSQEHQSMLGELFVLLRAACPADLKVLLAPFDVALAADTVVQPDIVVARRTDLTSRDLPTAPVLAVEVLSPSTR